jgi:hypothetical protein
VIVENDSGMFRSDYLTLFIGGGRRQAFELAVPANIDRPQTKRSMTMKKLVQSIITALLVIILIVGLSGCTKEGPAEKAGKQITGHRKRRQKIKALSNRAAIATC